MHLAYGAPASLGALLQIHSFIHPFIHSFLFFYGDDDGGGSVTARATTTTNTDFPHFCLHLILTKEFFRQGQRSKPRDIPEPWSPIAIGHRNTSRRRHCNTFRTLGGGAGVAGRAQQTNRLNAARVIPYVVTSQAAPHSIQQAGGTSR